MQSLRSLSQVTPTNPLPDGLMGHLWNASGKANSFLTLLLQFSLSYFYFIFFSVCVRCSVVSDSLLPQGLHSPLGSSVHGIFLARILEWVATSSFRESSWLRDWTHEPASPESPALQADSLLLSHWRITTHLCMTDTGVSLTLLFQ